MSLTEKMARIICEDSSNHGGCEKCGFYGSKGCNSMRAAKRLVDAGVAQVVRCENCRKVKTYKCPPFSANMYEDFCSHGERKDEEE